MAKTVTMADIAKVMGVSTVTVSKALSEQKGVSEELRAKIKQQAEKMGYRTNSAVYQERIKNRSGYNIGVVISSRYLDKYQSFYLKLYQEVASAATKDGCFSMLEVVQPEEEKDCVLPKLLQEKKADGLIIIGRVKEEYLAQLQRDAEVPLLYLDFYDKDRESDAVVSNSYFGMYKLTNYLFQMGHRDIGYVGTLLATQSITDRYFGYVKSLFEHGIEARKDWILEDRDVETGRTDDGFVLQLPEEMPTAFVCNCDVSAAMLVRKLEERGLRVPEDISVVGYDNYRPPGLCDVRITSYEVDMREMAQRAISMIRHKIAGEGYKQGVSIVEGHICYKDSVAEHK
jgi:DNA-binding LacI/PurR family transcriptional regulator